MKNYSKNTGRFLSMMLMAFVLVSCGEKLDKKAVAYQCPMHCEDAKTYKEQQNCPICKMELQKVSKAETAILNTEKLPELSIYQLTSKWKNQDNESLTLLDLKGNVLVVVMIYTSCSSACPRLVSDMRNIEKKIPEAQKENVKMIFISIDPKTDTPQKLKAFAKENQMDNDQWVFLTGSESDTREFAAVLAMSYKQISPLDFSHSNIISVFDRHGVLAHQQEGLAVDNAETVAEIIKQSK